MNISRILAELRTERARIDQAIAAIEAISGNNFSPATAKPRRVGSRRMSAAGRKRISEAAKAMWAERRKQTNRPRRHISAAGRKKLSAMMKARWAARRKAKASQ